MSATQSNLSAYGYDVVVATTQDSINEVMKEYLSTGDQPEIRMYWNWDPVSKKAVPVDEATLLQQLGGKSPFSIKAWDGNGVMPAALDVIDNSNFQFAFRAKIGLPSGYDPSELPDVIQLDPKSDLVNFNLLCSEFQIVETVVYRSLVQYVNTSQPDGNAWIFKTTVPLTSITDNTDLPKVVQDQLNNLGASAFSVQQLLLDLNNAALQSTPVIDSLDPSSDTYVALMEFFVGAYLTPIKDKTKALPVLGYTLTANNASPDPSTLKISHLEMEANAFYNADGTKDNTSGLSTLNYLCAANGSPVKEAQTLPWNWLDTSDASSFDGVTSINRNTLVSYFSDKLNTYILSNCWLPSVKVTTDGLHVYYEYGMTAVQQPSVSPPTGQTVLSYSYDSGLISDQAGLNGDMGKMKMQSTFNLTVDFAGTSIVVKQHLVVYTYIENSSTGKGGNIIDKQITDTYSLGVDTSGKLNAVLGTPVVTDNSVTPGVNGFLNFFTDINGLAALAQEWINGIAAVTFTDVPVSVIQGFVFPGGKSFIFKDAMFSDNQDLISHITYIDPS